MDRYIKIARKFGNGKFGYYPSKYFSDFFVFLAEHKELIEIITYDDLDWMDDYDHSNNYIEEWKRWNQSIRLKERDPSKIYLLLQHDVDQRLKRNMSFFHEQEALSLKSNIMIFKTLIKGRNFESESYLKKKTYNLDFREMARMEKKGFVFGYHSNALEQASFDKELASVIFEDDVKYLRQHLDIKYFCPHGGGKNNLGESNNSQPIPVSLRQSLRWVANKQTVRFHGVFSDGGINSSNIPPEKRDLRNFVKTMEPGRRYRILTHPQYYHTPYLIAPGLDGVEWYMNLLDHYNGENPSSVWGKIKLCA